MIKEKDRLGSAVYAFSPDHNACVIYDPNTPRYWYNYLWNEMGYCAQISQTGHGRSYYLNEKADMCMLNGDGARYVYLRDEKTRESWNIGVGPMNMPVEEYRCAHAIASSNLSSRKNGFESSWRIFVPADVHGEIWTLRIKNVSLETREISVFSAVSFSLDGFPIPGTMKCTGPLKPRTILIWGASIAAARIRSLLIGGITATWLPRSRRLPMTVI